MKLEIKVPPFGESVKEATVASILKQTGEIVEKDQEILELETDKVSSVVTAPGAGELTLSIRVGDLVTVNQTIGAVDTSVQGAPKAAPTPAPTPKAPPAATSLPPVRKDADAYIASLGKKEPPPLQMPKPEPKEGETRTKMTSLRRTIAKRLVEAKNTTAMLTTFNEVDLSKVIGIRNQEKDRFFEKHQVKLGFMSFFIKACILALKEYPNVNAFIEGDEIVSFPHYNIGVAVSTEKGLMVPVLRRCETLSFAQIEQQLAQYAKKAREGKISIDEMQNGTFTITNGGVFGSLLSTPIINPPQSAILGMHAIKERPIAVNGKVEIRPMMYLALSYDHRIIDGKESVQFLVHIKENLEDPARILLDF